ncbi:MAG: hypothetical protein IPM82_27795 [Saprospiraceae bacterium]|nr:hypothetical protein [Saprospiraceae bacterium]
MKETREIDPNYIENNLFDYEGKLLKMITDKLQNKENINIVDSEKLIEALLSIKQRNKVF